MRGMCRFGRLYDERQSWNGDMCEVMAHEVGSCYAIPVILSIPNSNLFYTRCVIRKRQALGHSEVGLPSRAAYS